MPVINCPSCGLVWRTADRDGSYSVKCHDCGTVVQVHRPCATEHMPRSRPQPVPVPVPPPFEDTRTVREAPPPPVATQPRERPRTRPRRNDYEPAQGSSLGIVLVIVSMGVACLMVLGTVLYLAWPSSTETKSPDSTELAAAKTEPPKGELAKPAQPPKENPARPGNPAPRDNPPARRDPPPRNNPPRPREPARPPKEVENPTADANFNRAFADLKSENAHTRRRGADALVNIPLNEKREEVVLLLRATLDDSNAGARNAGIKALGYWGTKEDGPALMKLLDRGDNWSRKQVIIALGRLQYEPAAPALADCLADFFQRREAMEALKLLGSAGEKAVHKYLDPKKDIFLCGDVCGLLKDIGTPESIPKLEGLLAMEDIHVKVHVRPHAEAAVQAIKQREMK